MTKIHKVKAPKPGTPAKEFKSDRTWAGRNILTGEVVSKAESHGTPSIPADGFTSALSYVDKEGYVNCYVNNRLVSRYPTAETRSKLRKEENSNE